MRHAETSNYDSYPVLAKMVSLALLDKSSRLPTQLRQWQAIHRIVVAETQAQSNGDAIAGPACLSGWSLQMVIAVCRKEGQTDQEKGQQQGGNNQPLFWKATG